MALPADLVIEIRTAGSDTAASGGFSNSSKGTTGVDYSQQNAAQYTYSGTLSGAATTTLTGTAFTNDILGNLIQITGQGFYCITGYTSATAVTVDRALGTFSAGTGYVGGALATPGQVGAFMVGGNTAFLKYNAAAVYSVTSTGSNVAGGRLSLPAGVAAAVSSLVGYDVTRTLLNTDANQPTIRLAVASGAGIWTQGLGLVRNVKFDNPGAFSACTGILTNGNYDEVALCWFDGLANGITDNNGFSSYISCYAHNCAAGFSGNSNSARIACVAIGCTVGFSGTYNGGHLERCINASWTGTGNVGFNVGDYTTVTGCTAYSGAATGTIGFRVTAGHRTMFLNCIAANCATGFDDSIAYTGNSPNRLINCYSFNNTTPTSTGWPANAVFNLVTLTANPFNNVAGGDYGLNAAAGAGAAVRSSGYPASFLGISTTNALDGGAAQHYGSVGDMSTMPGLDISPSRTLPNTTRTVTLIGTGTTWQSGTAPVFTPSGLAGVSVSGGVTVINDTTAYITVVYGPTTGVVTWTDSTTGDTRNQLVSQTIIPRFVRRRWS